MPRAASPLRTAKQIVCSDDAWEIRMTLTLLGRERPEQPLRDARHADHARAAQRQQRQAVDRRDALGQRVRRPRRALLEISVPGAGGLNVFLMRIGIRFATAGAIVAE